MGDSEFNPFFSDEREPETNGNPFHQNGDDDDDSFLEVNGNSNGIPPTIQVEEKHHVNGGAPVVSNYTSLDQQQHVETIMRSVSMEEDGVADNISNVSKALSDSVDLYVKVDSPEKHVEGYVSYCVTTQTTRDDFEQNEYSVRRRYQDFLWLRQKLQESAPTHIIPPLPEKFTFSKHITDKYDQDFLKTRQKALDKFMSRIVDHPVMSFNDSFRVFLSAKAWEMTTVRKNVAGPMSKVGGSMRNTAAQLMMKSRDEEFTNMATYNIQFQEKVKRFAAIGDVIAQERFYLLDDFGEYATAFRLWSNSESKLADTLNTNAQSLDRNANNLKLILRAHESRICEPLREYSLYCDSVKLSLKRRDQIQIEHELSTEELQKRRADKEEVETSPQNKSIQAIFGKDPEKVREEKLEKLTQQISDLISESEVLCDKRATADQDIKADMERWQRNKKRDLKSLLLEIAERHIKYYENNVDAWQESLELVKKPRKIVGGVE